MSSQNKLSKCVPFVLVAMLSMGSLAFAQRCRGTATYRLDINYMWTADRFNNRPSFPHFSPLVAHSHVNRFSAFSRFGYATEGVKDVAELGATRRIAGELRSARNNRLVNDISIDPNIIDGDGSVSVTVTVTCRHRFISAITMIAPSPDWMLAIFRQSVVVRGRFINSKNGTLRAYDAGTDSGRTFTARDQESSPRQNIAPLTGMPFNGKYLATYKLTKI